MQRVGFYFYLFALLFNDERMKYSIFILSLLSITHVFGQKQADSSIFFNEFCVSANYTNLSDDNTVNGFGFGLGAYRSFFTEKMVDLTIGLEFNHTSQTKKSMYEGHFTSSTNVTYNLNNISIPLAIRITVGKNIKTFIDPGIFIDANVYANRKGIMHAYTFNQNNQPELQEFSFKEKVTGIDDLNYGPSLGIGLKIPCNHHELIIRTDYKMGLNKLYDYHNSIYNEYFRLSIGVKI